MSFEQLRSAQRAPLRLRDIIRAFQIPAPVLALAVMCFFLAAPAHAAEKKAPAATATAEARLPDDDVAMGFISRGEASAKDVLPPLLPLVGAWDYTESIWTDPKAQPERATGTAANELVMGQRYLSSKSTGTLNIGRETIPFEGMELIGFDTGRKTYISTRADSLTTGMMIGGGTYDEKNHTLNETGRFTNPLTGAEEHFRSELRLVDLGHYTRTVFATGKTGKETKLMEIDYSRR